MPSAGVGAKQFEPSGSPKSILRHTSSPSIKNEDVDKQLLLSTSVPIKIGNGNVGKKDARKCSNRIRYTFGLRTVKSTAADSMDKPQAQPHDEHKINGTNQTQSEIQDQQSGQPKSKSVDDNNLSTTNPKIVKQTTIDYYV